MDDLRTFFATLYRAVSVGQINLWSTSRTSTCVPLPDIDLLTAKAEQRMEASVGRDHYFTFGVVRPDVSIDKIKRSKNSDVVYMPGFHVDIDFGTEGHKSTNCPPTLEDALSLLPCVPYEPTMIVHTGGGIQAYYLFDRPVSILETPKFSDYLGQFQTKFVDAAKVRGWSQDVTKDLARLLRLPTSTNYKILGNPRPVTIIKLDGPRTSFETWLSILRPTKQVITPTKQVVSALKETQVIHWMRTTGAGLADQFKAMSTGKRFAEDGLVHETMIRMAGALACRYPDADPTFLAKLARNSFEDMGKSADREIEKFSGQISDCQKKEQAKRAEGEKLMTMLRDRVVSSLAETNSRTSPDDETIIPSPELSDMRHFLLLVGKQYCMYNVKTSSYDGPMSKEAVRPAISLVYGHELQGTTKSDQKGRIQIRSIEDMEEIIFPIKTVVYDAEIEKSWLDIPEATFHMAIAPMRIVAPNYSGEVDGWLHAIAGDRYIDLRNWLICAVQQEIARPLQALFMPGKKGAGKSLFAECVGRTWKGGHFDLASATGKFTDALGKTSFLWADESLPKTDDITGDIRRLIGNHTHPLNYKYSDNDRRKGFLRVLVTANNTNIISISLEKNGKEDIRAFAERFIFVPAQDEASSYLEQMKANGVSIDDWAKKDIFLAHVYHLVETYAGEIPHEGRFMVPQTSEKLGELIKLISHQSDVARACLEWITDDVVNTPAGATSCIIDSGRILVNPAIIVKTWWNKIKSVKTPLVEKVSDALESLSTCKTEYQGKEYFVLDLDVVIPWVQKNTGEGRAFTSRISRSRMDLKFV